jgi:hypothetical protein
MKAWRGDWAERIRQRVVERGYTSVSAFAAAHPVATFIDLALLLGDDVAAIQLEDLMLKEAYSLKNAQALGDFARCALVRIFRLCAPEGWSDVDTFPRIHAVASWTTALGDEYEQESDRVWARLESLSPPAGWLPSGPEDPLLVEAFRGVEFPWRPRK